MCGTCKFCLGFFQVAAFASAGMMVTVSSIFTIYGGMPPTYAMAAGFWGQYVTGWLAIYLTFYIVRVLGKGLFTSWTPKYCFVLIVVIIIFYLAAAICLFVPVTAERMTAYSRYYNASYKFIPPFLDKFQEQYVCCGINNYEDYSNILKIREPSSRQVVTGADEDPLAEDQTKIEEKITAKSATAKIKRRTQYYFAVPTSCCTHERKIKFKNCGDFVEYYKKSHRHNDTKIHPNARLIINNVSAGCLEKYELVMSDTIFQLNWMLGIIRWGSLAQSVMFFILIWIYRLSLRAMRRNMKGEVCEWDERILIDDDGEGGTLEQGNELESGSAQRGEDVIQEGVEIKTGLVTPSTTEKQQGASVAADNLV